VQRHTVLEGSYLLETLLISRNPCIILRNLSNDSGGYGLTTGITDAACLGDALAATIKDEKLHLLGDRDLLDEYSTLRRDVFLNVSNKRSVESKKTCQLDPNNLPKEFLDGVAAAKKNPEITRQIMLTSMDLQTLLDIPQELKGEEWGVKGKPVINRLNGLN
jgi:2-polyprenyl-6-methoxyphenol hydroxylase-like FAD-dependent oxidoreductase